LLAEVAAELGRRLDKGERAISVVRSPTAFCSTGCCPTKPPGALLGAARSRQAGRAAPILASYVRVALGPGARQRLRDEERHYRNINEAHRQHFEAMDVPLGSVGVAASARPEVLDGLAPYHSVLDLPIARLLTDQDATSLPAAAVAAAP
jgi:hypothetical protein